jgi:hypothetical protein
MELNTDTSTWRGFVPRTVRVTGNAPDVHQRQERAERSAQEAEEWVLDRLRKAKLDAWLVGEPDLRIDQDLVEKIRSEIESELSGYPRKWATNFLARGLERGKLTRNWNVIVPARVVTLKLPTPPLHAVSFSQISLADELREEFVARWSSDHARARQVLPADILFAAIAFSGVLHRKRVMHFIANIETGVRQYAQMTWIEWQDEDSEIWDRVILDEITTSLLLRWLADPERQAMPTLSPKPGDTQPVVPLWKLINTIVRVRDHGLTSLTKILAVFRAGWCYVLPPFLYHWAIGKQASAMLPPSVFGRMLTKQRLISAESPEPLRAEANATPMATLSDPISGVSPVPIFDSGAWIPQLRGLLRTTGSKPTFAPAAVKALEQFSRQHSADSLPRLLCDWLISLLRSKRQRGKGLRLGTARAMLSCIDRRLALALEGESPLVLQDRWPVLLAILAENVGQRQRINVVNAIKSFHEILMRNHGLPPLSGVDFGPRGDVGVDANLINETEFLAVRHVLAQHDRSHPDASVEVGAILAFRGALRRSELRGLRLSDFCGYAEPYLLVRSNSVRQLKRDSSRRRIDLAALCQKDELQVVMNYIEQYRTEVAQSGIRDDGYALFPDPTEPGIAIRDSVLFAPIEDALRDVTGDGSLRFHHLRHSTINLMLLHTQLELVPAAASLLMPDQNKDDQIRSQGIVAALVGATRPLRPRVWSVAAVAGHATPETTFGSYVHICDNLLAQYCQRSMVAMDDQLLSGLSGLSRTNLRVRRHRSSAPMSSPSQTWVSRIADAKSRFALRDEYEPTDAQREQNAPAYRTLQTGTLIPRDTKGNTLTASRILAIIGSLAKAMKASQSEPSPGKKSPTRADLKRIARSHYVELNLIVALDGARSVLSSRPGIGPRRIQALSPPAESELRLWDAIGIDLDRPLHAPHPVKVRQDETEVNAILQVLADWLYRDAVAAKKWSELHWLRRLSDTHILRFADQSEMRTWLTILQQFRSHPVTETLTEHLVIRHLPNSFPGAVAVASQRQYWERGRLGTGIPIVDGEPLLKRPSDQGFSYGMVEIYLANVHRISRAWAKSKEKRANQDLVSAIKDPDERTWTRSTRHCLDAAAYVLLLLLATENLVLPVPQIDE